MSEEDHALWRYGASPDSGTDRTAVDRVVADGGRLAPDIEGVTLVDQPDGGGYVIASAQNVAARSSSYFTVYGRGEGNAFVKAFRITGGPTADDCDGTDGIAAYPGFLGSRFPDGLFVCQDNYNSSPGTTGNQDFKYADLGSIVDTGTTPPDDSPVAFVAAANTNGNRVRHRVQIPSGVQTGDRLVLLLSDNAADIDATVPTGWSQLQSESREGMTVGIWTRTATSDSAGQELTVTTNRFTKSDLSVAAYRGDSSTPTVAASASTITPGRDAHHTTPTVPVTDTGSWLISYWGAQSSTATAWTPPVGQTARATSTGDGGGYLTALLTDSAPLAQGPMAGSPPPLTPPPAPHSRPSSSAQGRRRDCARLTGWSDRPRRSSLTDGEVRAAQEPVELVGSGSRATVVDLAADRHRHRWEELDPPYRSALLGDNGMARGCLAVLSE